MLGECLALLTFHCYIRSISFHHLGVLRTERSGKEGHVSQQDFPGTLFDIRKHPLGLHLPSFTHLVRMALLPVLTSGNAVV